MRRKKKRLEKSRNMVQFWSTIGKFRVRKKRKGGYREGEMVKRTLQGAVWRSVRKRRRN